MGWAQRILKQDGFLSLLRKGSEHGLKRIPHRGIPLYFRLIARQNWKRSGDYAARPDPFRLIEVSPHQIEYNSTHRFSYLQSKYGSCGLISDGDWDRDLDKFSERTIYEPECTNTIYRSLALRFEEGLNWEDVPYVQQVLQDLDKDDGISWHGCSTREEVMERCHWLDELCHDIAENGYRSKRELLKDDPSLAKTNPDRFHFLYDEVLANVGRDGRLLFVGGHHRLSIAKILDISQIPVRLYVRHHGWQQLRDRIHSGHTPPEGLYDHSDLQDVIEGVSSARSPDMNTEPIG